MMEDFFEQEIPVLDGSAYDKVCIAVERGEIGAYISNCKYQSVEPGNKYIPITVTCYGKMLTGLIRYLDEHPDKEAEFSNIFITELQTCPHIYALVTLIEMLYEHVCDEKKSFFTEDLIMTMANQIENNANKLEDVTLLGSFHNNILSIARFIDKYVYKKYGIHLVRSQS